MNVKYTHYESEKNFHVIHVYQWGSCLSHLLVLCHACPFGQLKQLDLSISQCRRRWANIKTTLGERPVFAGKGMRLPHHSLSEILYRR